MSKINKPLLFALCLLPIAVIAGVFINLYQLDVYPPETLELIVAEVGSTDMLIVVGVVQTVGYGLILGFIGHILANKIGLWKQVKIEKNRLIITLIVSLVGGIIFSLDHWIFGSMIEGLQDGNVASLTVNGVIASVLYGGIIEEVMMRLFFMSFIAFILWKVFCRRCDREHIPTAIFVIANIVAALLFAAGHLPVTISLMGTITPLLLFRCFLLNGGFGLIFGWLYRKHGIIYAMMGHALFHIVCKLIWMIFI